MTFENHAAIATFGRCEPFCCRMARSMLLRPDPGSVKPFVRWPG
eukprot:CAMPEP_0203961336 /NCGR_PEP_ID=MMETSP0359-20131031/91809_1 /ASSEMBLY_ACC=CAM_ASM_000338 /TAXON_ID=268821 /ORGANISM="Scrippsiella Hangoei, Strain SHTV-5" /LENGTH=43 /DNA_ID= /DNA_START= /DNA_END= /DNA_ORIENTATION=